MWTYQVYLYRQRKDTWRKPIVRIDVMKDISFVSRYT